LYENNLNSSEASLQNKIKNNDIKKENKFSSLLQKLFECFKQNKIENNDSSMSYNF
jgi:hypothetical protein